MISFGVHLDFSPWFRFWFGGVISFWAILICMAFLSFILIWRVLGSFIFFSALLSGLHRVCDFFNFIFLCSRYCITAGFHGVQCMSRAIQVDGVSQLVFKPTLHRTGLWD